MPTPKPLEVSHAYRHLYRGILHAVQYSKPSRYVARDLLRDSFRKEDMSVFDEEKIERTLEFLRLAAKETGLEHKIVKTLIRMRYSEKYDEAHFSKHSRTELQKHLRHTGLIHYKMTLAMLNDSMGLCLR